MSKDIALTVEDFELFYEGVHGKRRFDWQHDLLRRVVHDRAWPLVLDLPTGSGKTSCIDIALFALALDAQQEPGDRWCPRRIAMVVDRRVVVDQAAERGRTLLRALVAPDAPPVVAEVARRLRSLSRVSENVEADPVGVFTLRGGMPKDDGWARTPDQPLIIASTVDQLGSRLLIQGYGVSDGMKPVHAGLAANDILILLDEVHLSKAFAETLEAVKGLRERFRGASGLHSRFGYSFLSATPGKSIAEPFRLDIAAVPPDSDLGRRLHAHKPARLLEVADRPALERMCSQEAQNLLERHATIAVVVNRVASAATIARDLRKKLGDSADVHLLTGRMRPLDRDDVLRTILPRIKTGRERVADKSIIIVSTQCIEAGADFDFDAIVSESASIPALKQRFGRIDRLGIYERSEGVIIRPKNDEDWIYGDAGEHSWTWLKSVSSGKPPVVDFGIVAMPVAEPEQMAIMASSHPDEKQSPALLPAYLDSWMQTAPAPEISPDVSLWLHGPDAGPPDVQVVWRANLNQADLAQAARQSSEALDHVISAVAAVRPSSLEAMPVPFHAARRWLAGESAGEIADVELAAEDDARTRPGTPVLRWNGEKSQIITSRELRPGDTIVVPSERGGIDANSFDPDAIKPVPDLAERAALMSRGQPMLRLHPKVLEQLKLPLADLEPSEAIDALEDLAAAREGWERVWLDSLVRGKPKVIPVDGDDPWVVLEGKRIAPAQLRALLGTHETQEDGIDLTTDADGSSHAGEELPLSVHCDDVEKIARAYAVNVGLPQEIVEDISLAAWLHDIGKADDRFQIMLHGGSEIDYFKATEPIAKSNMPRSARSAQRFAQLKSGYPRGARHELQSVALIEASRDAVEAKAHDIDLVLHLIASHHGHCRPFAPVVTDERPIEVSLPVHDGERHGAMSFAGVPSRHDLHRIDSPVADRFWRVVERYGWHELCWLESMIRLADHRASEMRQGLADGGRA